MIMEVENMSRKITSTTKEEEDDDVPPPGFRFHPTDEELVGFYLKRKVEKRPISNFDLIKQADIYKYDPWDLPKSNNTGDDQKEWYFFCKRGRKYKNSIRPNRVTGSGFWKATGIDRPIYESRECIGLKKSLVYYRGSAGKGTKTEWMMHEFRLPPVPHHHTSTTKHITDSPPQEAEVWTLCRILKRNVSYRKSCTVADNWRDHHQVAAKIRSRANIINPGSSETCSVESCDQNAESKYISFEQNYEKKPFPSHVHQQFGEGHFRPSAISDIEAPTFDAPLLSSYIDSTTNNINELIRHADWEDLRSILEGAAATATINPFYL